MRGEIALRLQAKNRHTDIVSVRYWVDAVLDITAKQIEVPDVPTVGGRARVNRIIRAVCETEPADPDREDTVCIGVYDLEYIVAAELEALILAEDPLAQQPAAIPRLANCGRYTATDNTGQHYYLNHANTWQAFQGQQPADVDEKYAELIYAVANKYPGESRHETALRYIRQAESADHGDAQAATQPGGSDNDQ